MKTAIDTAVLSLAARINEDVESADALRFTQAALNLMNVQALIHNIERSDKLYKVD